VQAQQVENSKAHESIVSLSPDGKILFIYKLGTLWRSDLVNDKWSAPVQIGKEMISKDYVNHVSITEDGKTIYYTSEKKNSTGNLDIYKAEMKSDGSWTNAENIGDVVNSPGNEQSPYISADGKTLYFSSNGHGGFGGYDIFKCTWNGKKWSKPENMGMPYNSISDDVFFCPKKDLTEGFFSSNRKGGIGSYDIYRYFFADVPSFDQSDVVIVGKKENLDASTTKSTMQWVREQSSNPATEKMFFRINGNEITDDVSKVEKLIAEGKVKKLEVEQVEKCGNCAYKNSNFYTAIDPTTDAMLAANNAMLANNMNNNSSSTTNSNPGTTTTVEKKFVVYFDFNSKELTPDAYGQIAKAAAQLKQDEKLNVEVTGYADYKGSAGYNKNLSYKRANVVKKQLADNDIKKKRIKKMVAGGELETDASCIGKPCEEEQNAKNRRVEIIIRSAQ
ncbi:MAG TPA: OmpA family protein, partial [Bacteroidia bacterium]